MLTKGKLNVCATPIGNLGDITLRVLNVLKDVDVIAAEDTRHSRKLLNHYDIKTRLVSYHQHNEKQKTEEIILWLKEGKNVALISDAGTPGISDPGNVLISRCLEERIEIDVLPGANAAVTALVLSGLPTDNFIYLGFLPSAKSERKKVLAGIAELPYTIILYEAPHRLLRTLQDTLDIMGERNAVVARELTKIHQSVYRGQISELINEFQTTVPKGECCLLLAPFEKKIAQGDSTAWLADLKKLESESMDLKDAMKIVAKRYGISKKEVYKARIANSEEKK